MHQPRAEDCATNPHELPSGHLAALHGVRGLAILLVLAYHFTLGMTGRGLVSRLAFKLSSAGWCGVDLFFVLSGFLITGILADTQGTPRQILNFYARRSLRIFPLYYATLLIVFSLRRWGVCPAGWLAGLDVAWVWLWTYGTNVLAALRGEWFPLSHFWSLAVEEHFYLFWPAVVVGCPRRTALRACGVLALVALATRVWLVANGAVLAAYCLTVCRIDALVIGGFLALSLRESVETKALVARARLILLGAGAALVALIVWRRGLAFHDPVVQTVGFLLLALVFAALIALVVTAPERARIAVVFRTTALCVLGRYSYGLYVFNSIVILIFEAIALRPRLTTWLGSIRLAYLLEIVLASSLTFAAAWTSWHVLEKHFLKLKRYFGREARGADEPGPRSSVIGLPSPHIPCGISGLSG
jgi:peptidoglycan/LPS O-acetylase OafA/YrhL